MDFIYIYILFIVIVCLCAVIFKLIVIGDANEIDWRERYEAAHASFATERQQLLDRIMSRDFVEYKDHTELEPNEQEESDPDVIDVTDAREDLEEIS